MFKKLKIRLQLLFVILPLTILPPLIIALFSSNRLFDYLEKQNTIFYSTVLRQISNNLDFFYNQYGMALYDITLMENFNKIVNNSSYHDKTEEQTLYERLGETGDNPKGGSIRRNVLSKIAGEFYLVELDKKSLISETDYKQHAFSSTTLNLNIANIIKDPLFLDLKEDKNKKLIFGKLLKESISGFESEKRPVFIYPYYANENDDFQKFIIVILDKNFVTKLYQDISTIQYGTLYIIDKFNNIISKTRPSDDDYYEYDESKKQYVLGDDNPNDPAELLNFEDYKLLNTDENILKTKQVTDLIKKVEESEESHSIKTFFNGIEYLVSISYSPFSKAKLVYFHPISQVYKPINRIILFIIIITILVILIAIITALFFSRNITNPIKILCDGANIISKGNYKHQLDIEKFSGELLILGNSFNNMSKTVSEYSENLEDLVHKRTEELSFANLKMKQDLIMAQKIQEALIPKILPKFKDINLSGMYIPMENLGGDLYDVFKLSDTKIGIVIFDVCGHGVAAALITTMAKVSFSSNSNANQTCGEIMFNVNNDISRVIGGLGDYLTAFYGIIDTEKGIFQYSNASHVEPYILRKEGSIIKLEPNSSVIGVIPDLLFAFNEIELLESDKLVFYTDGITEARNKDREIYGNDRFRHILLSNINISAKEVLEKVIADVNEFKGDSYQDDDMTLLIADISFTQDRYIKIDIEVAREDLFKENQTSSTHFKELNDLLVKALDEYKNGNYDKSIELIDGIQMEYQRNSDKFVILNLIGHNYYKLNNFTEALKYWNEALLINPNNEDLITNIEVIKRRHRGNISS
ncbi:MAG: hypothetical protein A2Y34_11505 [Spirochaetes bacterium GWC1_27_15]|nr:MAG: hypothetical protein A2Z98_03930 [Spirochaetes bacterium GWB1_27_13]OHD23291.1 MAG: hypothetical protein A2Y34_11505 [Spirochaetes bacterium GWC1_27_15]